MYYDMSGFDYGILDVVQVLHLRKRRGNYYDCPFCGETHGKLNINVEKNVFRCNRCDASGGMLKLYADLHNVTLSEANQQIREALGKGEYRTDYIKATPVQEEKATAELAPIEEIHRTYQRMLSMLTLNRKHQEDLQRRGLKPEQIEAQRYRSVPLFGMKKLVKRLAEEGYMVKGVPGFYRDTDGNWTINFKAENSGILIPIVSLDGFIQGFQIRVDHVTDTKKYIWLSSVNYDQGVSSGSPVHVIGDLAAERVYLTEGALKGTIAHYLSGATFVCVAGVNQYRNLKPSCDLAVALRIITMQSFYGATVAGLTAVGSGFGTTARADRRRDVGIPSTIQIESRLKVINMRSYKRYTRRKRLLKQIAVVALSPNRVFTKEQIYQHIYEEAESEVNNRIYGLIKNLRKKIEENPETPHYIETIRGVGYRFRA